MPFSDLTSNKKRPVVILSNDAYNSIAEDVICFAVTAQIRGHANEIIIDNEDMVEGHLPKISCIRADKVYTLNQSIIEKKYGKLSQDKLSELQLRVIKLISE